MSPPVNTVLIENKNYEIEIDVRVNGKNLRGVTEALKATGLIVDAIAEAADGRPQLTTRRVES